MGQPRYISGETLLSAATEDTATVISTWAHVDGWRDYEDSPQRRDRLERLGPLVAEPTTTEIWVESPVIG